MLQSGILHQISLFLQRKERHVQLYGLKFIKELVAMKDWVVLEFAKKEGLFQGLMELIKTIKKDGLLIGTIREIFKLLVMEKKINIVSDFASQYKELSAVQVQLLPELRSINERYEKLPSLTLLSQPAVSVDNEQNEEKTETLQSPTKEKKDLEEMKKLTSYTVFPCNKAYASPPRKRPHGEKVERPCIYEESRCAMEEQLSI